MTTMTLRQQNGDRITSDESPHARFPAVPEQVAVARRWLAGRLGTGHPAVDDATLLLSEAFGNSVRHRLGGMGWVRVGCRFVDVRLLEIEVVDDGGTGVPVVREDELDGESGRGLLIMQMLAKEWGWERLPDGCLKVWFRIEF